MRRRPPGLEKTTGNSRLFCRAIPNCHLTSGNAGGSTFSRALIRLFAARDIRSHFFATTSIASSTARYSRRRQEENNMETVADIANRMVESLRLRESTTVECRTPNSPNNCDACDGSGWLLL